MSKQMPIRNANRGLFVSERQIDDGLADDGCRREQRRLDLGGAMGG